MEKLWKEFQDILNEYLHKTEEYHNEYIELRQRDDEDTKIIRLHYHEVARATEQIGFLKLDLESIREDQKLHIGELLKYKKLLQEKQRKIKSEMEEGLSKDKNNLRHMVVCSHNVAAKLKEILKRGENILQIASICKKLETEREQAVPFGRKKSLFGNAENELKKAPEEFKEKTMFIVSNLENFWLRYNSARIDCACLNEEKLALKEENRVLKDKLKAYLTTVTIANGGGSVKDKLRPSSMKVERIGHVEANNVGRCFNKDRRRPVTCVSVVQEGNLSVAVRSKHLTSGKFRKEPEVYSIVQGCKKISSQ
ncbi:Dynein regulatory complex subunit 2 [Pseudolycoriella hygida]|uniref:Dynein regulatory complex subunit 2 n=1 Tax=Pseudolycoriella hygida TaxID=35572 RepID=A0A9Q0S6W1_9DIPT|nr:Dynein regulatory complex subunit 2 [Pseudolycoriella hygida]